MRMMPVAPPSTPAFRSLAVAEQQGSAPPRVPRELATTAATASTHHSRRPCGVHRLHWRCPGQAAFSAVLAHSLARSASRSRAGAIPTSGHRTLKGNTQAWGLAPRGCDRQAGWCRGVGGSLYCLQYTLAIWRADSSSGEQTPDTPAAAGLLCPLF